MKLLLLLLLPLFCNSQNNKMMKIMPLAPASRFEKDGKIWVSFDSKRAETQTFRPIEEVYQCNGNTIRMITDTSSSKGFYTLHFGKDCVIVKDNIQNKLGSIAGFSEHIMFVLMCACTDDHFVYCQCGEKFPIVNKYKQ